MNDQQLDDLKQFIDSRISQSEQQIRDDLQRVEQKVDDGFAGVAEAMEGVNKQMDEHAQEADQRLTRLEQRAA